MTEYISDREQIISLWIEAFGDRREDVELFLDTLFKEQNYFSVKRNGQILSQTFLVPVKLSGRREAFDGYYFCCAATRKDRRGEGLMASLLNQVKETVIERGKDFVALIPASDSLFNFYSKFGFESFFCCNEALVKSQRNGENIIFSPVQDVSELLDIQQEYASKNPGLIVKSREIFNYLAEDARLSGYKIYAASNSFGKIGYIFFDPEKALIREALISDNEQEVLAAFGSEMGLDSITVRQKGKEPCRPKGMIFAANKKVKELEKYFPFINNLLES